MVVRRRAVGGSSGGRPAGGGRAGVPPSDKGTLDAPGPRRRVGAKPLGYTPMPNPGDYPKPDAPGAVSRARADALRTQEMRRRALDPRYSSSAAGGYNWPAATPAMKKGGTVKPVGRHKMSDGHMMKDADMPMAKKMPARVKAMPMKKGGSVRRKKAY